MPTNTTELQLFKKDPATDGATNFNVQTMLNENWDKLDARALLERAHRESTNNPHSTTAAQVGAYTKAEADTMAQGKADTVQTSLNQHTANKTNPHAVTAAQTGAYTKAEADTMAQGKADAAAGAVQTDLNTHKGSGGTAHAAAVANGANGFMTGTDKAKLDGIAANANNYSHPTGDGNRHVPATGTTNNGKVLKAGSTAASEAWGQVDFSELTGKPTTLSGYGITDAAPSSHVGAGGTAHAAVVAGGANGFMTGADKTKLDGIAANANNYSHPTGDGNLHVPATGTTNSGKVLKAGATAGSLSWDAMDFSELANKPTTLSGYGITDAAPSSHVADKNNPHAVTAAQVGTYTKTESDTNFAPKSHVGAGGTAHANAVSNGAAGFMTGADKAKLDGIATGAQANQNAFSNVVVGSTTIAADSATDSLTLAATAPITITPDATNDKVTFDISNATTAADGAMSAADKLKLDGIAASANNYVHPTTSGNKHIPAGGAANQFLEWSADGTAVWSEIAASQITEDASNRFVTDTEKAAWNDTVRKTGAQTMAGDLTVNGEFTVPNQPYYRFRAGSGSAVLPQNTDYKIPFNLAGTDVVNGVFTAPTTGRYQINLTVYLNLQADKNTQLKFVINSAVAYIWGRYHNTGATTVDHVIPAALVYNLSAGDKVQFNLYASSVTSNMNLDHTVLTIVKVN